ncbi:myb domain protein [Ichthyophthirius multifiliis]|uniref:Myb domain protein n=1 Tax=Ichthyophthirius multifiliis TaxID=5932 RepID=G0R5N5_ICHMU|nr:myb domain protein [Ichthyophthirius multifiliis]EGR27208.1 myb domain protein [Ichthyophthirius multifiliis]|eukprot:XP_004024092.1 myb domain protein [Ichthyophthirius multifiliis]
MKEKIQDIHQEEEQQIYFDLSYIEVDRIIYSNELFPIIHPKKSNEIKGKWSENMVIFIQKLLNFSKDEEHYGLAFMEPVNPEKDGVPDYNDIIQNPIDFGTVINRVYLDFYQNFNDILQDIGQVFKNCRIYHQDPNSYIRIQYSLNWLIESWYNKRNVILADEMGLGKTIQSISFINHLYTFENVRGPFLIIAPLSTLQHWKRTVDEWTNLNALLYQDEKGQDGRNFCVNYESFYIDISTKGNFVFSQEIYKFQVLITSNQIFMSDLNNFILDIPFQFIVVDEAHKLKNSEAKFLQNLKKMPCKRVLLLTGTPIQNNTEELWTLLNYIEPQKFSSLKEFKMNFGDLQTEEQVNNLQQTIKPYLLRRMKEDVENSIPPLQETIIDIEMTTIQKTIYRAIYEKNKGMLKKQFSSLVMGASLNNLEMQLRKCQFYLKQKLIKYEKIDGSIKSKERQNSIDRFNDLTKNIHVFLLSTKAGGLGINLTSASIVIIFDSDWNPQNDVQATARAHRIGQTQEVQVYRFITKKTYEAEMFERASKKLGIDQAVFMGGEFKRNNGENNNNKKMEKEQIETLLKKGIIGLLNEEEEIKKSNDFFQDDIEQILQKNSRIAQYSIINGNYTFQKSSFIANKGDSDLNIDDPNFWNKVLKDQESKTLDFSEKINKPSRRFKKITLQDLLEGNNNTNIQSNNQQQQKQQQDIYKKLCSLCEQPKCTFFCQSFCKRSFHEQCKETIEQKQNLKEKADIYYPKELNFEDLQLQQMTNNKYICIDCQGNMVICFICKNYGIYNNNQKLKKQKNDSVNKCSTANCNKYYHLNCIKNAPLFKFIDSNNKRFRCSLHYCASCTQSGDSKVISQCIKCPKAYHLGCLNGEKIKKISKKQMICEQHNNQINLKRNPTKEKNMKQKQTISKKKLQKIKAKENAKIEILQKEKSLLPYQYFSIPSQKEFDYLKYTKDWCRYCGARFSSNFTKGPWGPRTLCTVHYIAWNQKKKLDLRKYKEIPLQPINPDDLTELSFINRLKIKYQNFDFKLELEKMINNNLFLVENQIQENINVENIITQ